MLANHRKRWRRLIRRRFRRRPLLPFLLAATLAIGAVVVATFEEPDHPGTMLKNVWVYSAFGFGFGLLGLAAIWFVHSPRGWALRLAVGLAIVAFSGWLFGVGIRVTAMGTFFAIAFALQALFALIAMLIVQRIRRSEAPSRRTRQFSMGGLMTLMTAAAGLMALSRWSDGELLQEALPLYLLAVEATVPAALLVVTRLFARPAMAILIVGIVLAPAYSLILYPMEAGIDFAVSWLPYLLTQVATLLVWLLGLRVRRNPTAPRLTQESEEPVLAEDAEQGPPDTLPMSLDIEA